MKHYRQTGFTLIELMVTVAIITVVTTIAVVAINPGNHADSARDYAERVRNVLELAQQRAISTQRYQQVVIQPGANQTTTVQIYQAPIEGMVDIAPLTLDLVHEIPAPNGVEVFAYEPVAHVTSGSAAPNHLDGLVSPPCEINFAPDGTTVSSTIFIADRNRDSTPRIVLFGATGTAQLLDRW